MESASISFASSHMATFSQGQPGLSTNNPKLEHFGDGACLMIVDCIQLNQKCAHYDNAAANARSQRQSQGHCDSTDWLRPFRCAPQFVFPARLLVHVVGTKNFSMHLHHAHKILRSHYFVLRGLKLRRNKRGVCRTPIIHFASFESKGAACGPGCVRVVQYTVRQTVRVR